jgi:hypothetical protein
LPFELTYNFTQTAYFTTAKFGKGNNPPDKSAFAEAMAGQAGGLSDWAELVMSRRAGDC